MPSSHTISETEWQRHKAEIERLYVKDGRTRQEVMALMIERHGFQANKEQYVRRFKKWNLSKNSTDQSWAVVGHKIQKRQRDGKASAVFYKGKMIAENKIKKNISRHPRSASDLYFQHAASPTTPQDMTICTPDNQDQPFVSFRGIPWFTYQAQLDFQIQFPIMRQADAGGPLDLRIIQLHDDTGPSAMSHFLSDLERGTRSMPLPTVSGLTKLVKDELEYRNSSSSGPSWEISSVRTGVEIVQAMIFMSSNNLSSPDRMDYFLMSVIDSNMRWALKTILAPKSPTTEIFATKLLQSACRMDDSETIQLSLSVGADPNAHDGRMERPLFLAVKNGCTSSVKLLIEHGADVNPPSDSLHLNQDSLTTALYLSNPIEMVQLLLKAGAAVRSPVLDFAVRSDNIEVMEMILAAGAHDVQGTALQIAVQYNKLDMARRLLMSPGPVDVNLPTVFTLNKHRNSIDSLGLQNRNPLVLAVRNGNVKMIEALLDAGADINFVPGLESKQVIWNIASESGWTINRNDERGYLQQLTNTALQTAANYENLELVQFLLAAGAFVDTYHYGDTALQIAVKRNNVPLAKILLAHGANVHASSNWPFGRTALQAASENGNLFMIDLLLGTTPRSSWSKILSMPPNPIGGRTALQAAAENGHMSMVKQLLRQGVDINGQTACPHGTTVVQAAVRSRNLDMTRLVLAAGAGTGTPPGTVSSLAIVIDQHDSSMFELMFNHAANFCSTPNEDERPFLQQAAEQESPIFLEILLQAGLNVNEIWRHGHPETAIGRAVQKGRIANANLLLLAGADARGALVNDLDRIDTKLLALLLEHGADPNVVGEKPYNFTPLARIARPDTWPISEKLPIIRILLNAGATVDCPSPYGPISLLATAVHFQDIELCKLLLTADADPNFRYDTRDITALEHAACGGSDEIFYLLLNAGAEFNVSTPCHNMTALQRAALSQNLYFVRTLLQLGADVNAPPGFYDFTYSARGMSADSFVDFHWRGTALQVACRNHNEEIIDILLGAGADVNAPAGPKCGLTALQAAAGSGNLDRVQKLLRKGADVNAPASNEAGVTALQAASICGHLAVVVLLLHKGADISSARSSKHSRTALEGAAEWGRLDIVHLLLENDHNMDGFYDRCEDAAFFAEKQGHRVIARILRNYRKD